MRFFVSIVILSFFAGLVSAQILPAEGAHLNYTLAGFSIPAQPNSKQYRFEFATGICSDKKCFEAHKIKSEYSTENRIITKLPSFGSAYTWRVVYEDNTKGKKEHSSAFYHIYVDTVPYIDTSLYRLKIIDQAKAYYDLLVVLDTRVIYDIQGTPVWFLPDIPGKVSSVAMPRDLKATSRGTFTFLIDNNAYEIDYNGKLLWEAAHSVDTGLPEIYHHDFTRLSNGHYMIASQTMINFLDSNKRLYPLICGVLVELDSTGKQVWKWNAYDYLRTASIYLASDGQLYMYPHLNSFYFDEDRKLIYTSFRNISSIIKIAYPSGEVLADYHASADHPWFEGQHSCRITQNGDIYIFNNGALKGKEDAATVSSLRRFTEFDNNDSIRLIWEFPCDIDNEARSFTLSGGSIYELPYGDFLACMGVDGRVFIVSQNKKILWNSVPQQLIDHDWHIWPQYRSSFIDSATLTRLIFR